MSPDGDDVVDIQLTREQVLQMKNNFWEFIKYVHIRTIDGKLVKFKPNAPQKQFYEDVFDQLEKRGFVRMVKPKARQRGISTAIGVLGIWYTIYRKGYRTVIVAHEIASATDISNIYRTVFDNLPEQAVPNIKSRNERRIILEYTDNKGKSQESSIRIATAKNMEGGRGGNIQFLHLSEVAYYPEGRKISDALVDSVHDVPGTFIFLESTGNGEGDYFHSMYEQAIQGRSSFVPAFYAWHIGDQYTLDNDNLGEYIKQHHVTETNLNDYERKLLLDCEHVTYNHLAWYRKKLADKGGDDAAIMSMKKEFPSYDHEAFMVKHSNFFDNNVIEYLKQSVKQPDIYRVSYNLIDLYDKALAIEDISLDKPEHIREDDLHLWYNAHNSGKCIIAVDPASGNPKGDPTSISIMDVTNKRTVARMVAYLKPTDAADISVVLARLYNNCMIVPEENNHGHSFIQRLKALRYHNIYRRIDETSKATTEVNDKLGFQTNTRTKTLATDRLRDLLEDQVYEEPDERFLEEARVFIEFITSPESSDKKRYVRKAMTGKHDDIIMSVAIGVYASQVDSVKIKRDYALPEEHRGKTKLITNYRTGATKYV